jgi:hypothetical protein
MNNLKPIFLILIILLNAKIFAQDKHILTTENIFSISYTNSSGEISSAEDVKISLIGFDSLIFQSSEYNSVLRSWQPVIHKVGLDKINSFGYKSGLSKAGIIGRGALIGFGTGFILGCITGKISLGGAHTNSSDNENSTSLGNRLATGLIIGAVLTLPAILISALIPTKPYENLDISKYDFKKKSEILLHLIKKGIKENI